MRLSIYVLLAMFLAACGANQTELNSSVQEGSQNAAAITEPAPSEQMSDAVSNDVAVEPQDSSMAGETNAGNSIDEANSQTASQESMDAPVSEQSEMNQDISNIDAATQEKEKSDSKS